MAKSIYVGNLPWSATEEQVQSLFADYGPVVSVKLVSDRETGRARGFGFVEMEEPGASAAIEALDNANFGGRAPMSASGRFFYARPNREGEPEGAGPGCGNVRFVEGGGAILYGVKIFAAIYFLLADGVL